MISNISETIWHYTSIDTLIKICSNLTIRATHHAFMNDAEEVKIGAKFILSAIEELSKTQDDKDAFEHIRKFTDDILNSEKLNYFYITSFSKAKDTLSQWRGYTPAHGGCAIGFDKSLLLEALANPIPKFPQANHVAYSFVDCIYPQTKKAGFLSMRPYLKKIKENNNIRTLQGDLFASLIKSQEIFSVMGWLYGVKNPCFEDEQETRLVFQHIPDYSTIQFENGKPFLEFSIKNDIFPKLIKEVMISPHGDVVKNEHYVRFFSQALGEKYRTNSTDGLLFPVTKSVLPYRG